MKRYVIPRIGGQQLGRVTPAMLNALYTDLLATGPVRWPRRAVAEDGEGGAHDTAQGAARCGAVGPPRTQPCRPCRSPSGAFTRDAGAERGAARKFLKSVEGDRLCAMWLMYATTACGAVRRWACIGGMSTHDHGRIAVVQALLIVEHKMMFSESKTNKGRRSVALDPTTAAALRTHRAAQAQEQLFAGEMWTNSGLVFTTELGRPIDPQRVTRNFDRDSFDLHRIEATRTSAQCRPGSRTDAINQVRYPDQRTAESRSSSRWPPESSGVRTTIAGRWSLKNTSARNSRRVRSGLLEDRPAVVLHRPRRAEQALGDRGSIEVLRDQRRDFALALTERERLQAKRGGLILRVVWITTVTRPDGPVGTEPCHVIHPSAVGTFNGGRLTADLRGCAGLRGDDEHRCGQGSGDRIGVAQHAEQRFGARSRHFDVVGGAEDEHSGCTRSRSSRRIETQRVAHRLGDRPRKPTHQRRIRCREVAARLRAVKDHPSPSTPTAHHRRAHLKRQTEWTEEVVLSRNPLGASTRGPAEDRRGEPPFDERSERVHVVALVLASEHSTRSDHLVLSSHESIGE